MKVAEILKGLIELVAAEQQKDNAVQAQVVIAKQEEDTDQELEHLRKLAGFDASTKPDVHVYPLSAAYPAGDDVHYSKNPADIRADSISMYPGYQAEKK